MTAHILIAGGGIGGLAMALAACRAGCSVQLFEQAPVFSEVGAGLQLGPNATRILHAWGLAEALEAVAAFPQHIVARSSASGRVLAQLPLGRQAVDRYGAPYATLHRHDLHEVLMRAVQAQAQLHLGSAVQGFEEGADAVHLFLSEGRRVTGDALVAADGVWSALREPLWADGPAQTTGHLAYRALLPMADVPASIGRQDVTAWLGPRLHLVTYPVRSGTMLNLVLIVQGEPPEDYRVWHDEALAADVRQALAGRYSALLDLVEAVPAWGRWTLCDRPPLSSPAQMAQGRVALLGDAAHPMRPFLAQGAGMAIEDAAELGRCLGWAQDTSGTLPAAWRLYAERRWQRVARVQARARRNGEVFHASGLAGLGRDVALALLGRHLMDLPWLYGHGRTA